MKRWKLWSLLFVLLAVLTLWAVSAQSRSLSPEGLLEALKEASPVYLLGAGAGTLGFIVFEGAALLEILKALGYRRSGGAGFLYSAADVYFSAITPSASGGQPASAFFMIRDGVPGAAALLALAANLILYTLALLAVGLAGWGIRPEIFSHFGGAGELLILLGFLILAGLTVFFWLLIARPRILEKICGGLLELGIRLRIVRKPGKRREKLAGAMEQYRACAGVMGSHRAAFCRAFGWNLLQRLSQISVTVWVYLALGGEAAGAPDVWVTQSLVTVGTYSVPIPGGMGAADYLLLKGLGALLGDEAAVCLGLIARGMSFYLCILVSGLTVLAGGIAGRRRRKNRATGTQGETPPEKR